MTRCTATSKQTGEQCKRHASPGSTKCRNHGGRTPRGVASATFQNKGYSKVLTARLLSTFETAMADPDLLSLRQDVALTEARLTELLSRLNHADSQQLWDKAGILRDRLVIAQNQASQTAVKAAVQALTEFIEQGVADYAAWSEITSLLDTRRKLVESERKRLIDMQQMISSEQAMQLVTGLLASVKRHVTDVRALSNIQQDFIRYTQVPGSAGVDVSISAETRPVTPLDSG